jgi:hypothetical protein
VFIVLVVLFGGSETVEAIEHLQRALLDSYIELPAPATPSAAILERERVRPERPRDTWD